MDIQKQIELNRLQDKERTMKKLKAYLILMLSCYNAALLLTNKYQKLSERSGIGFNLKREDKMYFNKSLKDMDALYRSSEKVFDKLMSEVTETDAKFYDSIQYKANDIIRLLAMYDDRGRKDYANRQAIQLFIAELEGSDNDLLEEILKEFTMKM